MKIAGKELKMKIYMKFALSILAGSIIPIALLATVITNWMFEEYRISLEDSYEQGVAYASYSVEALVDGYNDLSKFSYFYNPSSTASLWQFYGNSDNLRGILNGSAFVDEKTEEELQASIEAEMNVFLSNLINVDTSISAAHFLYYEEDGSCTMYHATAQGGTFVSDAVFEKVFDLEQIDTSNKGFQIFPTHSFDYVVNASDVGAQAITVARNYYNVNSVVSNLTCVGTLLIDFNLNSLETIFTNTSFLGEGETYLYKGDTCIYSTDQEAIGTIPETTLTEFQKDTENFVFVEHIDAFDIYVVCYLDSMPLDSQMQTIQQMMYAFLFVSVIFLIGCSIFFSSRLTLPIRRLMKQMEQVENGKFNARIAVTSKDELGDLTERFNQMMEELDNYTNQVYVAKIQQKEAELNALKSQIYPHFLYNTLEVIRMTALSRNDEKVAHMIEALSDQIRYLIGTVGDIVPLSLEVDVLRKYIYLVNARYNEEVMFLAHDEEMDGCFIPKLILQPLVENAFVHGIKPQNRGGSISLRIVKNEDALEITVMDNGQGMDKETLQMVEARLASDQPGRKEEYQWNSIGLKNVHDRIRFLYGVQYGISLFSTPELGTAVKITLPSDIREEDA